MDAQASTEQQAHPGRSRPATILFYILLQTFAAGLSANCIVLFFRDIKRRQCQDNPPIHIPEYDICILVDVRPAVTLYIGISAFMSLVFSGPLGRLLDVKGRRELMAACGLLNASGDIWLYVCASVPALSHSIYPPMLAAVFKGMGGASIVVQAAHWSFIASAARAEQRSIFFSLALFMSWAGSGLAFWGSAVYELIQQYAGGFMISFWCWVIYSLGIGGLLRDGGATGGGEPATWSFPVLFQSVVNPIRFILSGPTLRWLVVSFIAAELSLRAFDNLFTLSVERHELKSLPTQFIYAAVPLIRFLVIPFFLPLFVAIHCRFTHTNSLQESQASDEPSEQTPLLAGAVANKIDRPFVATSKLWRRESAISLIGFLAGIIGVGLAYLSQSPGQFILGTTVVALIGPTLPMILSMITLQAEPLKMGSTLTGFCMLEGVGLLLGIIPTLRSIYGVTTPTLSTMTILSGGAVLSFCGAAIMSLFLRPAIQSESSVDPEAS